MVVILKVKSQPFEILSRYMIQLHFKLMKSLYNDSTLFTLKTNREAKETVNSLLEGLP